jgi:hypothetical protein
MLRDFKTGKIIKLPHGNTKYRTKFSEGTGFHGKTFSQIRKMGHDSADRLIKALKKAKKEGYSV